jgi:hypothetical protein
LGERVGIDGGEDDLVHHAFREVVELSLWFFCSVYFLKVTEVGKELALAKPSESRMTAVFKRPGARAAPPYLRATLRFLITRRHCVAGAKLESGEAQTW